MNNTVKPRDIEVTPSVGTLASTSTNSSIKGKKEFAQLTGRRPGTAKNTQRATTYVPSKKIQQPSRNSFIEKRETSSPYSNNSFCMSHQTSTAERSQ
jgi:hypothetical protein